MLRFSQNRRSSYVSHRFGRTVVGLIQILYGNHAIHNPMTNRSKKFRVQVIDNHRGFLRALAHGSP
jgi:hypothetical protein